MGIKKKNTTTNYNIYQNYNMEDLFDCWDIIPCDTNIGNIIKNVDIAEDYWEMYDEETEGNK